MKKLLLFTFALLSGLSYSQGSCAAAITLTGNGVTTVPPITGTYQLSCNGVAGELPSGALGNWYKYVATSTGQVALSSNLPQNVDPLTDLDDTRVSVYSGTCAVLTCVDGSDDVSASNYLTELTFSVVSGTTYYIQWDNRWSSIGFDFQFTFTAVGCLPVTVMNPATNISSTGITLNWAAAAGAPAQYEVEYGAVGFVQGGGTTVTVSTNSITLSGLAASTPYDYYIRSKCGAASFSTWTAVNSFTTAKVCPQAVGFEVVSELIGWTTFGNGSYGLSANAPTFAHAGNFYWIFNTNATAASNNWLYTAPFSIQANETVTISFWIRSGSTRSLRLTAGNASTSAAQTNVLWTNAAINNPSYVQYTATFTPTTAGIYYFGWNDISTAQPVATMRMDTISFSSVLSTSTFDFSGISVYPNPINESFTIGNTNNLSFTNLSISDINGRIVKKLNPNSVENINISDLNTGLYFLNIESENGSVTKKIIKK